MEPSGFHTGREKYRIERQILSIYADSLDLILSKDLLDLSMEDSDICEIAVYCLHHLFREDGQEDTSAEKGHFAPECRIDVGELGSGDASADDRELFRESGHRPKRFCGVCA
jgi:hypothetical protein